MTIQVDDDARDEQNRYCIEFRIDDTTEIFNWLSNHYPEQVFFILLDTSSETKVIRAYDIEYLQELLQDFDL